MNAPSVSYQEAVDTAVQAAYDEWLVKAIAPLPPNASMARRYDQRCALANGWDWAAGIQASWEYLPEWAHVGWDLDLDEDGDVVIVRSRHGCQVTARLYVDRNSFAVTPDLVRRVLLQARDIAEQLAHAEAELPHHLQPFDPERPL